MGLLRGRGCEVWEDNGEYGVGVVKRHYSKAREGLALAAVALITSSTSSVSPERISGRRRRQWALLLVADLTCMIVSAEGIARRVVKAF